MFCPEYAVLSLQYGVLSIPAVDDGGSGSGVTFLGYPGPIPKTPRDNISRKRIPSLRLHGWALLLVAVSLKTIIVSSLI